LSTEKPLITVIVSTYNAAGTLQGLLDSYSAQSWRQMELIVVDGASTDGTQDILKANDHLITKWTSEPDNGIYDAWNKALEFAAGTWIYFIGADDQFSDVGTLERVAGVLPLCTQDVLIAYAKVELIDRTGKLIKMMGEDWSSCASDRDIHMPIPHQGTFHHKRLFELCGLFDAEMKIAGDYEMLMRAANISTPMFLGEIVVAKMRDSGVSTIPENYLLAVKEDRIALKRNGLWNNRSRWHFAKAMIEDQLNKRFGKRFTMKVVNTYRSLLGKRSRSI